VCPGFFTVVVVVTPPFECGTLFPPVVLLLAIGLMGGPPYAGYDGCPSIKPGYQTSDIISGSWVPSPAFLGFPPLLFFVALFPFT